MKKSSLKSVLKDYEATIEYLNNDSEDLLKENSDLHNEVDTLHSKIETLEVECDNLRVENNNLKKENKKLKEEVSEIEVNISEGERDVMEYADCLMCLFDSARRQEEPITIQEIFDAFEQKLEINKKRTWKKNDNGSYSHVK